MLDVSEWKSGMGSVDFWFVKGVEPPLLFSLLSGNKIWQIYLHLMCEKVEYFMAWTGGEN